MPWQITFNLLIAEKFCHCRNPNTLSCAVSGSLSTCSGDDLTVSLEALPKLFYRAPLHSAVPTSADSSCMPVWMTHFCCLCTWSLWEHLTGKHFLLTFICSHSLFARRKWLFQEVILGEASLVPCLWTEHERKALSTLTGVSGMLVLGTT